MHETVCEAVGEIIKCSAVLGCICSTSSRLGTEQTYAGRILRGVSVKGILPLLSWVSVQDIFRLFGWVVLKGSFGCLAQSVCSTCRPDFLFFPFQTRVFLYVKLCISPDLSCMQIVS